MRDVLVVDGRDVGLVLAGAWLVEVFIAARPNLDAHVELRLRLRLLKLTLNVVERRVRRKETRRLRLLAFSVTDLHSLGGVRGEVRLVPLRSNRLRLLNIGIEALITFAVVVGLDHKARQMILVLGVVGTRAWDAIIVFFLALIICTSKNRLSEPTLEFSADFVVTDALAKNLALLDEHFLISLGCLGYTEGIRSLCMFNDVFVLIWCWSILRQVRPVSLGLAKGGILKLLARVDAAWQIVRAGARSILLPGLQMILAAHVRIETRPQREAGRSRAGLNLVGARSQTITVLLLEVETLSNNCVSLVRFLPGELAGVVREI